MQRKEFARNLQKRVTALGGEPAHTGRATGSIHGSFTRLRRLAGNDSLAAANEVYRGESYIIEQMNGLLHAGLTSGSRSIVQAELARVTADRDTVAQIKTQIEARLTGQDDRERTAEQSTVNPG